MWRRRRVSDFVSEMTGLAPSWSIAESGGTLRTSDSLQSARRGSRHGRILLRSGLSRETNCPPCSTGSGLDLSLLAVLLGAVSGQLGEVTAAAFEACKTAVMTLALPLAGIMALWLGVMRLAEKSGLVDFLAAALRPIMRWLFPDVPANHPAMGSMVMNMAANMLGLANAATPLGLRAMQDLERLNPRPGVATNAMCTFLAINTSSIQLIPATTVAILSAAGATNPTSIIGTAFMATICSTAAGIIAVKSLEKLSCFALPKVEASSTESVPALE